MRATTRETRSTEHGMRHMGGLVLGAGLAAAAFMAEARDAHACGGMFCDSGPQAMPVDQSGENILFILDGPAVETHIQIQYTGSPEKFAWVIPLSAVPEFRVGSQALFAELLRSTVPSYGLNRTADMCAEADSAFPWGPRASEDLAAGGGSSSGGSSGATGSGGPQIVLQQAVGSFDVTVLSGGTATEVMEWLNTNGYAQLPGTLPLLEQYQQENFYFAALKLHGGAGLSELHPIVLRFENSVPCVPLRLTAVAATPDMGVRTFFLGNNRVVPRRFRHLEVNPLRIDWLNMGANYSEVLSRAADDPAAGGQAFVTESAGPSNVIVSQFYNPSWTTEGMPTQPEDVISVATQQGVASCTAGGCNWFHPLAQGIVNEFVPVPAGMTEAQFYSCLSCNSTAIDRTAWDAAGFAAAWAERVVLPAQRAADAFARFGYLTRLYTLISPDEMTQDPEFHQRAELPDVAATRIATLNTRCNGSQVMLLPDGREVELTGTGTWPDFGDDMPWAETVQDIPETGDIVTVADYGEDIDTGLSTWNRSRRGQPSPGECACSVPGSGAPVLAGLLAMVAGLGRRRRTA